MSVAIRAITRVQDADDFGSTPGAGNDGYALVWDNGAGEFVLAAAGVTDHGALAGLSDDDHSQYLLATGARTGASSQAQTFTVGVTLADTTTSTSGIVFKGADRFIHNFHHPTGGGAVPEGLNTFVGVNAGNFTTGSTATSTLHGSRNTAIGESCLPVVTTGYRNVAIGSGALLVCNTGYSNMAVGYGALRTTTTGYQNVAVGSSALWSNSTGYNNTAIGTGALFNVTGYSNVGIGTGAGQYQANGSTGLAGVTNSVYIGATCRGYDNSDANSIVIGYAAIGLGANTTVIGNTTTTAATIHGAGRFLLTDSGTNAVTTVGTLGHNTSGTAAAGFGGGLAFNLQSSTTASQSAALVAASWIVATHASRTARLALSAYDYNGAREGVRIDTDGSAALLGFYGHAAVAQQVLATGAGASVDNVISALQALGLVKQS